MEEERRTDEGRQPGLTGGLVALFAVAAGLAVGNLYWAQPLLAQITGEFGVPVAQGGMLVTATQIGYALGILLIVPLGDVVPRRKLITVVMLASVVALAASAAAPGFAVLALFLSLLGLTTVSGQIIVPLSGDLAAPDQRGRVVGIVGAGISIGILVARTVSGFAADAVGWRLVYVGAAVVNLVLALIINRALPPLPERPRISYPALLADVFRSLRTTPTLLRVMAISGISFGIVFNILWTSMTFLLAGEPFWYSTSQIGLVSLAGVAGAVASMRMGRLADGPKRVLWLGVCILACAAAMFAGIFSGTSIVALVVVAAVFSVACQGVSILCQTRLFTLAPEKRSRLNTCFVVGNFLCGSVGSALASALWNAGGWHAVMIGATVASVLSFGVWLASHKAFERFDAGLEGAGAERAGARSEGVVLERAALQGAVE